jgi:hypothetical protein
VRGAVKGFAASLARDAGKLSGRASAPQKEKSTAQEGLSAQTMYEGDSQACWRRAYGTTSGVSNGSSSHLVMLLSNHLLSGHFKKSATMG